MRIKELVKLHLKHTSKRISTVFSYWANPGCSDGMIKIPKDVGNAFLSDFAELLLDVASYEKKPFADELYARHFGANPDPQISH